MTRLRRAARHQVARGLGACVRLTLRERHASATSYVEIHIRAAPDTREKTRLGRPRSGEKKPPIGAGAPTTSATWAATRRGLSRPMGPYAARNAELHDLDQGPRERSVSRRPARKSRSEKPFGKEVTWKFAEANLRDILDDWDHRARMNVAGQSTSGDASKVSSVSRKTRRRALKTVARVHSRSYDKYRWLDP